MADDGIKLTREELYQKGWSKPATKLAKEIGISDVALGKICKKLDIPKPFPGSWHEAKLCLAGLAQSVRRRYAATMGDVEGAGRLWKACVAAAGAGHKTRLHCVGDGTRWIVSQVKEQFGERATFLVDFYHLSEYLGAAASAIAGQGAPSWLWQQQECMKANQRAQVLAELANHRERASVEDVSTCPKVRALHPSTA